MVEPKSKAIFHFSVFVAPCLILYLLFFITPFLKGIGISLTNWDGLTPKTPNEMEKKEFEENILDKLKQKDKDYVLKVYRYESSDDTYKREAVKGAGRTKLERIFRKTKWQPENNRFVGLENYKKVFTGKANADFYPSVRTQQKYTVTSDLPGSISAKEFTGEVLKKCRNADEKALMNSAYALQDDAYMLDGAFDSYNITDPLYSMPSIEEGTLDEDLLADLVSDLDAASIAESDTTGDIASRFISDNALTGADASTVRQVAQGMSDAGKVRKLLADIWVVTNFNMGVTGFTVFFAIFSVIGINVLAFVLALALDTGIKGQKVLRSIFFLPNVLSMIIVALIWSILFVQLLPAVTGIKEWISDSNKTPWLLVLVAVWQGCGYYMIIYLAGLQNIPTDIIEAAKIDGTSPWQRFRFITVPMILPAVTISLFLSIANALKSFDLIYAMIGQTGYATGTVPFVMDIYFEAFSKKQAGMSTAKAMVLFVAIFAITGIQLFVMKRKEVEA